MQVTSVMIHRTFDDPESLVLALASIVIDNMLVIHNIRILKNGGKIFVAMPNRKLRDETYKDVCHPINSEGRQLIETAVISAYEEHCKNNENN